MTEQQMGAGERRDSARTSDRNRWVALYVLCAGMLMIVLDVTVVNVALPSIQDDLGFSQSSLAWVVNAYLIAFGGLLLLSGRFGDILGRKSVFMVGLGVFTVASLVCGVAQSQGMLVVARFVQGVGGAMTSAVILGMIVTMFPEPRDQAKAIGVYAFVASAGGSIGLLAGGVLTQSINWHWIFFINVPIGIVTAVLAMRLLEHDRGIGFGGGADIPGAVLITSTPDARRLHDRQARGRARLGLGAGARARRRLARAARRLRRPRGAGRQPAHPAAHLPLAQRVGRQHRPGAVGRRDVRDVLPRLALHAAGARLRRARDRPCLPARDDRDGRAVAALLGPPDHALRREDDPAARDGAHRRRARALHPGAGRRELPEPRPAADGPVRDRRRPLVPGADEAGDVGRDPQRRRARLRPGQHLGAGRRRARSGGARDPLRDTQRRT